MKRFGVILLALCVTVNSMMLPVFASGTPTDEDVAIENVIIGDETEEPSENKSELVDPIKEDIRDDSSEVTNEEITDEEEPKKTELEDVSEETIIEDTDDIIEDITSEIDEDESISNSKEYKAGDIIKFGKYEQDGNLENGKEDIEWKILKADSNRLLVISSYALDCKTYNTSDVSVTWETCTLREWLNKDFLNEAFTEEERLNIPVVTLKNKNNPYKGTPGGNDTKDRIFCLSLEEMELFFGDYNYYADDAMVGYNQRLICSPTQFAIDNGATVSTITDKIYNQSLKEHGYSADIIGSNNALWWLRSPGKSSSSFALAVNWNGYAGAGYGFGVAGDYRAVNIAVRPALYIDFSMVNPESIILDKTSASMKIDEELLLTPTLLPENVTENNITWTSSNPEVATVSDGVVKALSAGKTTITARTVNDLTATCEITVIVNPQSIELNKTTVTMYGDDSIVLTA